LAVVLDLFSRQIIGWSMKSQMTSDVAIDALLMAVWRRKPKQEVMIHSDQGSQYSSSDWRSFLKANNLVASMSRRGNCHDNAVAESFFQLLKRERIKRKIYTTRQDARDDVFDYIEMFYNRRRQKLSATPDLSGTVLPLCLIPNSALKSAPPFKSVMPKASACVGLPA
jgi:putative transposase